MTDNKPRRSEAQLYDDRWEKMKKRLRQASAALYRCWDQPEAFMVQVTEVRIKVPDYALGEYMVILKGVGDGQKFIAFYKADDYESAVSGAILAWENDSIKWREDKPWEGGR